ncbi:MAG: ArsR family transcriptional regulator [Chloroflexi bacterium]|nr:ArsR family transcriptional regulator [Chloroflexota bacterium]
MQNTRTYILQIIQSRQGETVAGLSRELELAPATVRRHLDILQRDGLLGYEEVRHGTGRPQHVFRLTDAGHEELPKDYDALLSELVSELASLSEDETEGRNGEELVEYAFANIAHRAVEPYIEDDGTDPIEALRRLLTDRDFAPVFEVTESGIRITLNNCPFRSAAKDNPAICSFDTSLISGVLKSDAHREACIRLGDQCCTYVVADVQIPVAGQP